MTTWAIVPVKPLRYGKSRLAHILSADERAALTTGMLNQTLQTLNQVPGIYRSLVISRDPAALKIARDHGAYTYGEGDKQDLNIALTRAAHLAAAQEASSILIVPADLPLISVEDVEMMLAGVGPNLAFTRPADHNNGSFRLRKPRAMTICPDRNKNGTNALYISPPLGFEFSYGEGSFERHLQQAERLGMSSRIVHAPGLKFDLDTEDDWRAYETIVGAGLPA
ncbi:MAG: 2-phospho-L-lactate guanylyltransferase [Anaerolineae bacterium]|nr:2-phospho-L-lactate guanylyltransferase [Anaerolineae bacterium]